MQLTDFWRLLIYQIENLSDQKFRHNVNQNLDFEGHYSLFRRKHIRDAFYSCHKLQRNIRNRKNVTPMVTQSFIEFVEGRHTA